MQEIRWQQRFENYQKALGYLKQEIEQYRETELDIIKKGIIQSFEMTHELAWKVMQDYLKYQGFTELAGPRYVTRLAFQNGIVQDGEGWMQMLNSRNLTVHTYDKETLTHEFQRIVSHYLPLFLQLEQRLLELWQTTV